MQLYRKVRFSIFARDGCRVRTTHRSRTWRSKAPPGAWDAPYCMLHSIQISASVGCIRCTRARMDELERRKPPKPRRNAPVIGAFALRTHPTQSTVFGFVTRWGAGCINRAQMCSAKNQQVKNCVSAPLRLCDLRDQQPNVGAAAASGRRVH